MTIKTFMAAAAALALTAGPAAADVIRTAPAPRYGLIGRMIAQPGKRDALATILIGGSREMPGCLSYIVANDPTNPDALWVTEVWTDKAAHDASLALPAVRAAIATGRALLATMDDYHETQPLVPLPARGAAR